MTKEKFDKIYNDSFSIWIEDDSLTPDRETQAQALKRIAGTSKLGEFDYKEDQGGCIIEVYDRFRYWVILINSYPGNNGIRLAKNDD